MKSIHNDEKITLRLSVYKIYQFDWYMLRAGIILVCEHLSVVWLKKAIIYNLSNTT